MKNEKRKVISKSNLPVRSPFCLTLISILALDFWNASDWIWGVIGTILFLLWMAFLKSTYEEVSFEIFSSDWTIATNNQKKSSFQEKLEDKIRDKLK